ncbi:divisome protein SepX/GlpR [Nocardioides dongkuii]|uniref:divisome protein SepX/GlpR n=1 Tax=Nocardioides dongkuii TaxID=2760089 RepID=UPI001877D26F|nr:hypothetical protein [Nocardioides dongkuii]
MSALIFVALAVAWAFYLVPKALKHHDDVVRSRSVDRFSHTMRVLARREPVDRRSARLVVTPGRPASSAVVVTKPSAAVPTDPSPAERRARRAAAARATQRRRRVLGVLLLATAVVVVLAATGVHSWWYAAIPAGLLVAWLAACRLMVRREHAVLAPRASAPVVPDATPAAAAPAPAAAVADEVVGEATEDIAVVRDDAEVAIVSTAGIDPTLWDPVPVTLPTYVSKPAATRRTVRTIALDDTGVWTSGHTEADSRLARKAEESDRAERADRATRAENDGRAVGS